jgi:nucleoside-diphosphate-sugar epimerase/predicted dehydrogenase
MGKLRVGIVGCGTIFHHHRAFIGNYEGATLCAIADKNNKALEKAKELYGIERCYTDLEEMIRKEGTQVIHITTPPQTHAALAASAINLNNHVLIEKPMTLDYSSAVQLYALAQEKGVKLCVDHNHLFDPWMLKAKNVLNQIPYEDITYVESYYGINVQIPEIMKYPSPNEISWIFGLPGGLFHDFIAHPLYLLLEYTGKPYRIETFGRSKGALFQDITDELHVMVEGENATGKLTISFNAKPFQHFLKIYHKKSIVTVDFNYMTTIISPVRNMPGAAAKIVDNFSAATGLITQTTTNVTNFVCGKLKPYSGMKNLIHKFYDAIRNQKEVPISREKALDVMSVIDQIWKDAGKLHPKFDNICEPASAKENTKGKVLVTGAGGFLGRRLCKALVNEGYRIRVLLRKLSKEKPFIDLGAEIHYGDIRDPKTLKEAIRGTDFVIHAAAAQDGDWEEFDQTTIKGTEQVFAFSREYGVKRIVYISSMSVYQASGIPPGKIITEDSPLENRPQLRGFYTWSKLQAEEIAKSEIHRNDGVPIAILRPATIFGPGGPVFSPLVGISVFDKFFAILGKSGMILPYVYIDNLVDAILLSLEHENAVGKIFNVVDDGCITKRDYVRRVKKALFPKSVSIMFPYWFVYLGVFFQEIVFKIFGKEPVLTRYRLSSASSDVVFSNEKIKSDLRWSPKISMTKGLETSFNWYRHNA